MTRRVCPTPGCPAITDGGRCPSCARQHERKRGSRQARGYDAKHDALRRQWAHRVKAGEVPCAKCGRVIAPGDPWDLGHEPGDRTKYRGPEHARCNRDTAAERHRDT